MFPVLQLCVCAQVARCCSHVFLACVLRNSGFKSTSKKKSSHRRSSKARFFFLLLITQAQMWPLTADLALLCLGCARCLW